jgi:hypothetical protein
MVMPIQGMGTFESRFPEPEDDGACKQGADLALFKELT